MGKVKTNGDDEDYGHLYENNFTSYDISLAGPGKELIYYEEKAVVWYFLTFFLYERRKTKSKGIF
jgi:hypothetical protein